MDSRCIVSLAVNLIGTIIAMTLFALGHWLIGLVIFALAMITAVKIA